MTDRLFSDCCYGSEHQHMPSQPCPQNAEPKAAERARMALADTLDLVIGCGADADHLRKSVRVGDVLISHPVAIAAMIVFAQREQVRA